MYISTAITYQTHIEAGQGRGRYLDDGDDGDFSDDDDNLTPLWLGLRVVVLVVVMISMMKMTFC